MILGTILYGILGGLLGGFIVVTLRLLLENLPKEYSILLIMLIVVGLIIAFIN